MERLEPRQLLAADSIGVTPEDTGEFLTGTVTVTPVFFESNGQIDPDTQNWQPEEIDEVLAKVTEGVNWWSDTLDTLNTVHTLDFVIDDTFAKNPFETGYEPIDRTSSAFNLYVGEFVTAQGYGDANSIEDAVRQFNQAQRIEQGTDWAFTIFVADSSIDGDGVNDDRAGLFPSGGQFRGAFAFAGGLFFVVPSTRPTSTFTHEMGHIFWARDEYSSGGSWTDRRGYYNTQNLNAADNPTPGFQQEVSIMRGGVILQDAFERHVSPESTLAMVGWLDSDGDGVFDFADVPLGLDAVGYFDAESNQYHFSGEASAIPLINRNSSGPQSDITLNQISELQYSLDDGPWISIAAPNEQRTQFDLSFQLDPGFSSIRLRAIDLSTGITSEVIQGTPLIPAVTTASVSGVAFRDENLNGQRDASELTLPDSSFIVRQANGTPLFGGAISATLFADGAIPETQNVTLGADGVVSDPTVGSFELSDGQRAFHSFETQRGIWIDSWSSKVAFEAAFDQSVGQVTLNVVGTEDASFARLEGYDSAGQLIGRVTSDALSDGQETNLQFSDAAGRIASIRAFGHAGSAIAIRGLEFGFQESLVTDDSGAIVFENLTDGQYLVELVPPLVIYEFAESSLTVDVAGGLSNPVLAAAVRVDSPRFNAVEAGDVNRDGSVSSQDALIIINDMSRLGSRTLQQSETEGFEIDVSNDGLISARDALLVINLLGQQDAESENLGIQSRISSEISHQNSQMLNSAGDEVGDASRWSLRADTTDQLIVGHIGEQFIASKISSFADNPASKTHETITPLGIDTENENGSIDQRLTRIQDGISEPFQNSTV